MCGIAGSAAAPLPVSTSVNSAAMAKPSRLGGEVSAIAIVATLAPRLAV